MNVKSSRVPSSLRKSFTYTTKDKFHQRGHVTYSAIFSNIISQGNTSSYAVYNIYFRDQPLWFPQHVKTGVNNFLPRSAKVCKSMPILLQTMPESCQILPNRAKNSDCSLHFISAEFCQEKDRESFTERRQSVF